MKAHNEQTMSIVTAEAPRIAVFGGGTGGSTTAAGVVEYLQDQQYYDEQFDRILEQSGLDVPVEAHLRNAEVDLAIGMADDGGSSGGLSRMVGVLGLGDLRNGIGRTSVSRAAGELFGKRFGPHDTLDTFKARRDEIVESLRRDHSGFDSRDAEAAFDSGLLLAQALPLAQTADERRSGKNPLAGHNIGNLVLYGLTVDARVRGDAEPIVSATELASRMMGTRARIIPVTTAPHVLEMRDGPRVLRGEHIIDEYYIQHPDDTEAYLVDVHGQRDAVPANPAAVAAARSADRIIFASGSPYTSGVPSSSLPELRRAFTQGGKTVVVANLVANPHDTPGWCVGRFAQHAWQRSERRPDGVLYNTATHRVAVPEGATPVKYDAEFMRELGMPALGADLVGAPPNADPNDTVARTSALHNGPLVARLALSRL